MSVPLSHSDPHRRYRAPSENGEVLSVPDSCQVLLDAQENASRLNASQIEIAGLPLNEFRRLTRREVISRAVEWTNRLTGTTSTCADCAHDASLLFATGHQPQLAHPGVWAKNFATASLAKQSNGLGLNIVVDNDTVGTQSIRVPDGDRAYPRLNTISFDAAQPQQPWEELTIADPELFHSFGDRVCNAMSRWQIDPLIGEMWDVAIRSGERSNSTCEALTACRVAQERKWGVENLEIPLSQICQTESFLMFVAHLIENAPRFHADYNRIVKNYRETNRVRNDRHPVPNLEEVEGALELPFWFWKTGDATRGRIFVRRLEGCIELINDRDVICSTNSDTLLDSLKQLRAVGKLRTRALTTTLFARLCLVDQFTHGIGGAKYDEMADRLIVEFFGEAAPSFLVLSATCHLPIESFPVTKQAERQLAGRLRDLKYNADRYLDSPKANELSRQKDKLIREQWDASEEDASQKRARHFELKRVNEELTMLAAPEMLSVRERLSQTRSMLRANAILQSREFSAVLFPAIQIEKLVSSLQCGKESSVNS